jgi:hypothetical protein
MLERQPGGTWGEPWSRISTKDLRAEFPGVGGFSAAKLWRSKQFYEAYAKDEKLAPLVREISWTKNLVILEQRGTLPRRVDLFKEDETRPVCGRPSERGALPIIALIFLGRKSHYKRGQRGEDGFDLHASREGHVLTRRATKISPRM